MKVGLIQSNYIPWRGYFDFINSADLFIFHDDLQYTKDDWRNRNRIKTSDGLLWLTVPVRHHHMDQLIQNTEIDYAQPWAKKHKNLIYQWYHKAPFFEPCFSEYFEIIQKKFSSISELNIALCRWVMAKLSIQTPIKMSSEFSPQGVKTERIIDILKKAGADCYVSGPTAKGYLKENLFQENSVRLEYKTYDYQLYPQPYGEFMGNVTVLDLLFNVGTDAGKYIISQTPNEIAVP